VKFNRFKTDKEEMRLSVPKLAFAFFIALLMGTGTPGFAAEPPSAEPPSLDEVRQQMIEEISLESNALLQKAAQSLPTENPENAIRLQELKVRLKHVESENVALVQEIASGLQDAYYLKDELDELSVLVRTLKKEEAELRTALGKKGLLLEQVKMRTYRSALTAENPEVIELLKVHRHILDLLRRKLIRVELILRTGKVRDRQKLIEHAQQTPHLEKTASIWMDRHPKASKFVLLIGTALAVFGAWDFAAHGPRPEALISYIIGLGAALGPIFEKPAYTSTFISEKAFDESSKRFISRLMVAWLNQIVSAAEARAIVWFMKRAHCHIPDASELLRISPPETATQGVRYRIGPANKLRIGETKTPPVEDVELLEHVTEPKKLRLEKR